MDDRWKVVLEDLQEAVEASGNARRQLAEAQAEGGAAVARAEGQLRRALGGIPLARWRALANGRTSVRSGCGSRQLHLAAKSKGEVYSAIEALECAQISRDARVGEAAFSLVAVADRLASYGQVAERVTGFSADELRRLSQQRLDLCDGPIAYRVERADRGLQMATRDTVKDYQRRLAKLDGAHSSAQLQLVAARRRRAEVLAAQDKLVADAERTVDEAAVAMAAEVGPELAANLLDRDVSQMRRLMKRQKSLS